MSLRFDLSRETGRTCSGARGNGNKMLNIFFVTNIEEITLT